MRKRESDVRGLVQGVKRGNPAAASRALSLIVNEAPEAEALGKAFFRAAGRSHKIGLCGPPGAGKSTLAGRLIALYRKKNLKVGVLAVDPTSPLSGGAFLGDRLRLQEHATDPGVFVRSLASRGMIGGVTHTIFGAIHVLEAYGCAVILIETVGTGQDEVQIAQVADTVLYVTTPQMGDEIQAMKAGVMEIGDVFVVNKADLAGADKAVRDIRSALGLGREREIKKGWECPVVPVSAMANTGITELAETIEAHGKHLSKSGEGRERLKRQHKEELSLYLSRRVYRDALGRISEKHLRDLLERRADPATLGAEILGAGGKYIALDDS